MKRSKIIFLILAMVFIIILALIAIDFSSRTQFPGKKQPIEEVDSVNSEEGL